MAAGDKQEDGLRLDIRRLVQQRDMLRQKAGQRFGNRIPKDISNASDRKRPRIEVSVDLFPVESRPKMELDDSACQRSKRMFGISILGHLKKAKEALDNETTTVRARLHKDKEAIVEKKLALEKKNINEIKKREFREKRQQEMNALNKIMESLADKENELMRLQLIKHYTWMRNFIGTESQPTIFWIPKIWNETTTILQQKTQAFIDKKIQSIRETKYYQRIRKSIPIDTVIDTEMEAIADDSGNLPDEQDVQMTYEQTNETDSATKEIDSVQKVNAETVFSMDSHAFEVSDPTNLDQGISISLYTESNSIDVSEGGDENHIEIATPQENSAAIFQGILGQARKGDANVPTDDANVLADDANVLADDANVLADDANGPTDDANGPADDANGPTDDANGPTDDANGPTDDANGPTDDANGLVDDANGLADDANGLADDANGLADDANGLAVNSNPKTHLKRGDIDKLRVNELKSYLKMYDISASGRKSDLVKALLKHYDENGL